jgi:ELWxxDGT repeat protein
MNRVKHYLIVAGIFIASISNAQVQPQEFSYSSLDKITSTAAFFYFVLNDDVHGLELWRSDGTTNGTTIIKDINPGMASSIPGHFLLVDSILYFTADDGVHGAELWRSDGTARGTTIVKDIYPGSTSSSIDFITAFNNLIIFQADNGIDGVEIWKSDGHASGTSLIKDIFAGEESAYPDYFTVLDGKVYFRAASAQYGYELWRSDGTTMGTALVKDIASGRQDASPIYITLSNGTLFFAAAVGAPQYLYKSNGTAASTVSLKRGNYPLELINVNEQLFFTADVDGVGRELWKSDGTTSGTLLVKDIFVGASSAIGFNNGNLSELNHTVYFTAGDAQTGRELWRSDGSPSGTFLVKDIHPGVGESFINEMTSLNGALYFSAYDGRNGSELWKSDGSSSGTRMIKDIMPGSNSSLPRNFTAFADRVFFSIFGNDGIELWVTDGSSSGTSRIFPAPQQMSNAFVVSPQDGAANQKLDLTVSSKTISGAANYTIQISTAADFSVNVVSKVGNRSQRFTNLNYQTIYYTRVKTNLDQTFGRITSFVTAAPADYSVVISPIADALSVASNVNVTSNFVPQSSVYTIELNPDPGFASKTSIVQSGSRTIKFVGLQAGRYYYSRVRTDLSPVWGEARKFKTAGDPVLTSQALQFEVNVSPNPFRDRLQIRVNVMEDETAFIAIRDLNNNEIMHAITPTNVAVEYDIPLSQGIYLLHIQTRNGSKFIRVVKTN